MQEVTPPLEVVKEPSSSKADPKEGELEAKRKKMNSIKRFSLPGMNIDTKSKLYAEIATYKGEPVNLDDLERDLFSYWKERATALPILSKMFRVIHCIPATSAEIERVWSSSGLILNSRRSKLSNDNFKNLIFVKYN